MRRGRRGRSRKRYLSDRTGNVPGYVRWLTWYDVAVRRGVEEHAGAGLVLAYEVHVGVLVVVQRVGGGRGRGLGGRYEVVLR